MTARAYLLVWIVAISATLCFVVFVAQRAALVAQFGRLAFARDCSGFDRPLDAEIVVIGSSLTREALPFETPAGGILGDDRTHQLWAVPNISAGESLVLVKCASELGAETVLVEANGVVFSESVRNDDKETEIRSRFAPFRKRAAEFTEQTRHLFPTEITRALAKQRPHRTAVWDGTRPERFFLPGGFLGVEEIEPLYDLLPPSLAGVYLFEPPQTQLRASDMETRLSMSLSDRLQKMPQIGGFRTLKIWPTWSDGYFADYQSHMNAAGRARFLRELRVAWQEVGYAN